MTKQFPIIYIEGWKKGLQLDKDLKGDSMLYSPETCSWVTAKENSTKRGGKFSKALTIIKERHGK